MPQGYTPMGDEGGGEFLKMEDGDRAIVILNEDPFQLGLHRVDDGTEYGQKIYCGREDLGHCPICENAVSVKLKKDRRESVGFYSLFVYAFSKKGSTTQEILNKMMKLEGGWSVISPFQSELSAQQMTGETLLGIPMVLQRNGEGNKTRYNLSLKPNLKVAIEGEPIDLEEYVLGRIRAGWDSLGYSPADAPDHDPFAPPATRPAAPATPAAPAASAAPAVQTAPQAATAQIPASPPTQADAAPEAPFDPFDDLNSQVDQATKAAA